jgi:apolipoprotein N-acyltransferase
LLATLFVACAGVASEWLTTFTPLPVGIALCQSRNIAVLQIASVTGIWGVSFLLYLMNAALAQALFQFHRAKFGLAVAFSLLIAITVGGRFTWAQSVMATLDNNPAWPELTVAAVQDYNGADGGADAPQLGDIPDSEALTKQAAQAGAKLIVGTENALGITFDPSDPEDRVYKQARETGAYLVVGYESRVQPKPFNCAALVSPSGETLSVHHKIQLFLGERNAMQAGNKATVGDTSFGRVGTLICFDSCFTAYTRQAVANGAQIIALPNFDPPTPRATLHHLHSALMPFRAAENRVAIVRAEPGGLSQIVDPWGRIVEQAPMYRPEAVVASVPLGDGRGTFFTHYGDWWAHSCTSFALVGLSFCFYPVRRVARTTKGYEPIRREPM